MSLRLVIGAILQMIWTTAAHSADCSADFRPLCARLDPGSYIFIARPLSVTPAKPSVTVEMEVVEELWGKLDSRIVHIATEGPWRGKDPVFIAAPRETDGTFRLYPGCGIGLALPPGHPWVQQFRFNLVNQAPASVSVQILASGFLPLSGVKVTLKGAQTSVSGASGGILDLKFPFISAGVYRITAERPNFTYAGPWEIAIPPGSCGILKIPMRSASSVSGTLVNTNGEPIRNADLILRSTIGGYPWTGPVYVSWADALLDWAWRFTHQVQSGRDHYYMNLTRTDKSGRFRFVDVFPGHHYLQTYPSASHPEVYYPSARDWTTATPIIIGENEAIDSLIFRIPQLNSTQ